MALTGVVYPLASVMPELPEERVELLKATMPTLPILPVDLFSRGTDAIWDKFRHVQADYYVHNYPDILDLKVNGGGGAFDVVALTNWRSTAETQHVKLEEKLGWSAATSGTWCSTSGTKRSSASSISLSMHASKHTTPVCC